MTYPQNSTKFLLRLGCTGNASAPSGVQFLSLACGKVWVNWGKLRETLWKLWGGYWGKHELKIRFANFLIPRK